VRGRAPRPGLSLAEGMGTEDRVENELPSRSPAMSDRRGLVSWDACSTRNSARLREKFRAGS